VTSKPLPLFNYCITAHDEVVEMIAMESIEENEKVLEQSEMTKQTAIHG